MTEKVGRHRTQNDSTIDNRTKRHRQVYKVKRGSIPVMVDDMV